MNFLFISEILPIDTYASEVVFYRHFRELAKQGHQIHIFTDENSYKNRKKDIPEIFQIHILPNRKWYYPPFKPSGLLQVIRFNIYYYFFIKKIISEKKIDRLIGFIHGNFLLVLTAFIQEKTKLPLISFFHDDTSELSFNVNTKSIRKNTEKILRASKYVLIASEAFLETWNIYAYKFKLLYPIAESVNFSQTHIKDKFSIGYAGSVYNEIIDVLEKFANSLEKLAIEFVIIGNNKKTNYLQDKYKNVNCLPLFDTANEANKFLLDKCKYCVITYPEQVELMPWIKTCFPSKFIQNCILGIPTIIIAPPESAIGKWCIQNNWPLYLSSYENSSIIALLNKNNIDELSKAKTIKMRETIFNPLLTHQKFVEYLTE